MAKNTYIHAACSERAKAQLRAVCKANDLYIHQQLNVWIEAAYAKLQTARAKRFANLPKLP